jgi:hypothetical protein
MIYDGTFAAGDDGGLAETIDNNDKEYQRTGYALLTAADQQKYGDTTAEAVGAMNWKTGDVQESIPELRATNGQPADTSTELSPQGQVDGKLSNANTNGPFGFLGGEAASIANSLAGNACHTVTNLWAAGGIGLLSIAVGFLSGGSSEIAEQGVARALTAYIKDIIKSSLSTKELVKLGIVTGGVVGLTIYFQHLVANKSSVANSGLAVGPEFDNAADIGVNLNAQETARLFYGRPLTNAEANAASENDRAYQNAQLTRASFKDRYFSFANANSLVSRLGTALSGDMHRTFILHLFNVVGDLLTPLQSLLHGFGSLNPQMAYAAADKNIDNTNYGILQWGWSNDEEDKIKDPSATSVEPNMAAGSDYNFEPIENQAAYEGARFCTDYIWYPSTYCAAWANYSDMLPGLYAKCFEYQSDGTIDPTATMGQMLVGNHDNGGPYIIRNDNGNVQSSSDGHITVKNIDHYYITVKGVEILRETKFHDSPQEDISIKGDYCNPGELSLSNGENFDTDDFPPNGALGDLVFRYRLEKNYELVVDQQEAVQNAGSKSDESDSGGI